LLAPLSGERAGKGIGENGIRAFRFAGSIHGDPPGGVGNVTDERLVHTGQSIPGYTDL